MLEYFSNGSHIYPTFIYQIMFSDPYLSHLRPSFLHTYMSTSAAGSYTYTLYIVVSSRCCILLSYSVLTAYKHSASIVYSVYT